MIPSWIIVLYALGCVICFLVSGLPRCPTWLGLLLCSLVALLGIWIVLR